MRSCPKIISIFVLAISGGCVSTPYELGSTSLDCGNRWNRPAAPLVAEAKVAEDIFLAVEKVFYPQANRDDFPDVFVEDNNTTWSIGRGRAPKETEDGLLTVWLGGGQLSMQIAKCDGRIFDVHFTR